MGCAIRLIQGILPELLVPKPRSPGCWPVQPGKNALHLHGVGRTFWISPLRLSRCRSFGLRSRWQVRWMSEVYWCHQQL